MTAPAAPTWAEALAAYRAAEAALEAGAHLARCVPTDPNYEAERAQYDALVDAWTDAMDALIEKTPAPDLAALAMKIQIAEERTGGRGASGEPLLADHWQAIKGDIFGFLKLA